MTGTLILDGTVEHCIYKFPVLPHVHKTGMNSISSFNSSIGLNSFVTSATKIVVDCAIWHEKLGHPYQAIMYQILKGMDFCI